MLASCSTDPTPAQIAGCRVENDSGSPVVWGKMWTTCTPFVTVAEAVALVGKPTTACVPSSKPLHQMTQSVNFGAMTVAQFVGPVKALSIRGYAQAVGLLESNDKDFKTGAATIVSASAQRRGNINAIFTTTILDTTSTGTALAGSAKTFADALDPTKLKAGIAAAKAGDTMAYNNVTYDFNNQILGVDKPVANSAMTTAQTTTLGVAAILAIVFGVIFCCVLVGLYMLCFGGSKSSNEAASDMQAV